MGLPLLFFNSSQGCRTYSFCYLLIVIIAFFLSCFRQTDDNLFMRVIDILRIECFGD